MATTTYEPNSTILYGVLFWYYEILHTVLVLAVTRQGNKEQAAPSPDTETKKTGKGGRGKGGGFPLWPSSRHKEGPSDAGTTGFKRGSVL